MYKIMIVEDEPVIVDLISSHLRGWGYEVAGISDFHNVVEEVVSFEPDLILMDLYLPYRNGQLLTSDIRAFSSVPILFLTSADEDSNLIGALLQGADDYMTKPFELPVLTAKINALLRRTYAFSGSDVLSYNGVTYDLGENSVSYNGSSVELTSNEGKLLKLLLMRKSAICTREDLMEAVWKTDCYIDENTLSVNMNRLRKKLASLGLSDFIRTRKGQGYSL